ncbi:MULTISPECIES: hypothetical protein [Maritimibacter]|jgi:hypothetical protein|uniref:Uncharacterized protein n=1 Tax=Maritimibacter alkaliphilus HTCC2654 TaxID=314271 RepID=A3VBN7_9RHOB|nr:MULTISPECIES: hypothetical protein [Maritimibacter]EAQ14370.1 hypothetical protein RB2654_16911 [Rhodobacterales bacterium HTCC2654] [Maritimibacter alkaliphilus HTCC2654]TYP82539.1 hypothetical protein BD830_104421 [Maritimibacter alkaliphilus HTCC2654]
MAVLHSNIAHVLAGVLLMGGWAFIANLGHPWPAALIAGLVQGAITGTMTFFIKKALEWVAQRTTGVLPPTLAASTISATMLTVIHTLAGTPAFWATVIVPFTVATIYGATYTFTLRRSFAPSRAQ